MNQDQKQSRRNSISSLSQSIPNQFGEYSSQNQMNHNMISQKPQQKYYQSTERSSFCKINSRDTFQPKRLKGAKYLVKKTFKINQMNEENSSNCQISQHSKFIKKKNRPLLSSYQVINDRQRHQLIQMVVFEQVKVKEASAQLSINYQTAKSILRRYNNTGEISRQYKSLTYLNNQESFQSGKQSNQHKLVEFLGCLNDMSLQDGSNQQVLNKNSILPNEIISSQKNYDQKNVYLNKQQVINDANEKECSQNTPIHYQRQMFTITNNEQKPDQFKTGMPYSSMHFPGFLQHLNENDTFKNQNQAGNDPFNLQKYDCSFKEQEQSSSKQFQSYLIEKSKIIDHSANPKLDDEKIYARRIIQKLPNINIQNSTQSGSSSNSNHFVANISLNKEFKLSKFNLNNGTQQFKKFQPQIIKKLQQSQKQLGFVKVIPSKGPSENHSSLITQESQCCPVQQIQQSHQYKKYLQVHIPSQEINNTIQNQAIFHTNSTNNSENKKSDLSSGYHQSQQLKLDGHHIQQQLQAINTNNLQLTSYQKEEMSTSLKNDLRGYQQMNQSQITNFKAQNSICNKQVMQIQPYNQVETIKKQQSDANRDRNHSFSLNNKQSHNNIIQTPIPPCNEQIIELQQIQQVGNKIIGQAQVSGLFKNEDNLISNGTCYLPNRNINQQNFSVKCLSDEHFATPNLQINQYRIPNFANYLNNLHYCMDSNLYSLEEMKMLTILDGNNGELLINKPPFQTQSQPQLQDFKLAFIAPNTFQQQAIRIQQSLISRNQLNFLASTYF